MRDGNLPMSSPPEAGQERDRETMDQEKRLRREIANSNERRRMQSINAGFQSLRNLLPHHEGEKLSKAAILQQTAEYIHQLEQEKSRLMSQNSQLMKRFNNGSSSSGAVAAASASPAAGSSGAVVEVTTSSVVFSSPHSPAGETPPAIIKRRKTLDGSVESADEGIGSMSPDHNGEEYRNEVAELRRETMGLKLQLERERRHRLSLEDTLSTMRHQHHHQEQPQQQQQQHHQPQQTVEPQQQHQIVYVQQQQPPPPPPPQQQQPSQQLQPQQVKYEQKYEHERMQAAEEGEVYLRVPTPARNYDDHRVRSNLNSIVEAIRQLEGDHLFADDRTPSSVRNGTPTVAPPTASPPRAMEVCGSPGVLSSSQHHHHQTPPAVQSYAHCYTTEGPLALTAVVAVPAASTEHHVVTTAAAQQQNSSTGIPLRYHPATAVVPVSSTVTSLKHHVLNRIARSNEVEEQPINLEYRPVISRSPSPPPHQALHHHQQQHHVTIQQHPQQTTVSQFHIQQQLRPGVIVVKHS